MNRETFMKAAIPAAAVIASIGIGFAGITSAQSIGIGSSGTSTAMMRGMGMHRPAVVGKVTAISGTTLTVASTRPDDSSSTTYTVDASGATVTKAAAGAAPSASSVSAIAIGDMVAVQGTVTGTNVAATSIVDGIPAMGPGHGKGFGRGGEGTFGTVSAVSGDTITLTGKDGKTYTVDAASAKVSKISSITVGDIKVGDTLGVRGTLSGTNVTAQDIMDGMPHGGPDQK